jgi:hypothetical protein
MCDENCKRLDAVLYQGHGVLIHLTEDMVERKEDIFGELFIQ